MTLEGKGLPLRHSLKLDEVIASTVRGQQCARVLEILAHSLLADDLVSLAIPVGSKDSRKALSGGTHGCRRSTRTTCTGRAWSCKGMYIGSRAHHCARRIRRSLAEKVLHSHLLRLSSSSSHWSKRLPTWNLINAPMPRSMGCT